MATIEEKAYKVYPVDEDVEYDKYGNSEKVDLNEKRRKGYIKCAEEYESLPKIRGWVARHKNGELCLFSNKPEYKLALGWVDEHQHWRVINRKLFPEITIESEPVEVELLIRKV